MWGSTLLGGNMLTEAEAKAIKAATNKAWREANKDRIRAYKTSESYKARRRETRDLAKNRIACRDYYQRNKEKMRERQKSYAQANPEKMRELHRRGYENRGKQKALDGIKELSDKYIKQLLVNGTTLRHSDIPPELIKAKRVEMIIRREVLKNTSASERMKWCQERARKRAGVNPRKPGLTPEQRRERNNLLARERYAADREKYLSKQRQRIANLTPEQRRARKDKAKAKYRENYEEQKAKRKIYLDNNRKRIRELARALYAKKKAAKLNQQGSSK